MPINNSRLVTWGSTSSKSKKKKEKKLKLKKSGWSRLFNAAGLAGPHGGVVRFLFEHTTIQAQVWDPRAANTS